MVGNFLTHTRTISPLRTQQNQAIFEVEGSSKKSTNISDKTGNKDASRALIMVQKKLSSELSVEFKVNELLQQAMDPRNLSVIFPGWQPWL